MMLLKLIIALAVSTLAVSVTTTNSTRIEKKFVKAINDVVKESHTCVVLVIDGNIKLVTPEIKNTSQLAAYRNVLKNKNLVLIKSMFKPRSAKDIVLKLTKIGRQHKTFLAYFRATNRKPVKGSITTETTRPVGLLGNLLAGLGIAENEEGVLPNLLSSLGLTTTVKDINKVEFRV